MCRIIRAVLFVRDQHFETLASLFGPRMVPDLLFIVQFFLILTVSIISV